MTSATLTVYIDTEHAAALKPWLNEHRGTSYGDGRRHRRPEADEHRDALIQPTRPRRTGL